MLDLRCRADLKPAILNYRTQITSSVTALQPFFTIYYRMLFALLYLSLLKQ